MSRPRFGVHATPGWSARGGHSLILIVPCFFAARGGEGLRSELDEKLLGFAARLARSRSPAHVVPVRLHVPGGRVVTFIHAEDAFQLDGGKDSGKKHTDCRITPRLAIKKDPGAVPTAPAFD